MTIKGVLRATTEDLKRNIRSVSFWIMMIVPFLAAVPLLWSVVVIDGRYSAMAGDIVFTEIVLQLVMLVLGIRAGREGDRPEMLELWRSFPGRGREKEIGQILSVAMISLIYTSALALLHLLLLGIGYGASLTTLIRYGLFYCLYCFPGLTGCGWMGLWLGERFRDGRAYIIAFVFWFITGGFCSLLNAIPVAFGWNNFVMAEILQPLYSMLNWTGINVNQMGKDSSNISLAGRLEPVRWISHFCVLFCILFGRTVGREAERKDRKLARWMRVGALLMIVAVLLALFIPSRTFYRDYFSMEDAVDYYLNNYEAGIRGSFGGSKLCGSLEVYSREDHLAIQKEKISVRVGWFGSSVTCKMLGEILNATDGQMFTLDRNFQIHTVLVNNTEVPFERDRDAVWVPYGKQIQEGESVEICFVYQGNGAPDLEANSSAVVLWENFPWLPWPGVRADTTTSPLMEDAQITGETFVVEMTYSGPGQLYTNLQQEADGMYRGATSRGVTLLSGMERIQSRKDPGRFYYVPAFMMEKATLASLDARVESLYQIRQEMTDRFTWLIPEEKRSSLGNLTGSVRNWYVLCGDIGLRAPLDRDWGEDGRLSYHSVHIENQLRDTQTGNGTVESGDIKTKALNLVPDPSRLLTVMMNEFPYMKGVLPEWEDAEDARETLAFILQNDELEDEELLARFLDSYLTNGRAARDFMAQWYQAELEGHCPYANAAEMAEDYLQRTEQDGG